MQVDGLRWIDALCQSRWLILLNSILQSKHSHHTLLKDMKSLASLFRFGPNVLNHPAHPKHDVIPSGVFMPGKDGTPVHTTEELQQLIRLLHREHGRLGGTIAVCSNCSCALDSPPNVDNMFAGCLSPSECQQCGLRNCGVNYFPACRTSYLTIASCFWSWWRMQPVPTPEPAY